jgi:hypothetical protein
LTSEIETNVLKTLKVVTSLGFVSFLVKKTMGPQITNPCIC